MHYKLITGNSNMLITGDPLFLFGHHTASIISSGTKSGCATATAVRSSRSTRGASRACPLRSLPQPRTRWVAHERWTSHLLRRACVQYGAHAGWPPAARGRAREHLVPARGPLERGHEHPGPEPRAHQCRHDRRRGPLRAVAHASLLDAAPRAQPHRRTRALPSPLLSFLLCCNS